MIGKVLMEHEIMCSRIVQRPYYSLAGRTQKNKK